MNPNLPLLTQFRRKKSNIHNAFGMRTKVVRFSGLFKIMGPLEASWGKYRLTIVFNNISHTSNLQTGWGFACLIEGFQQTIKRISYRRSKRYYSAIMARMRSEAFCA